MKTVLLIMVACLALIPSGHSQNYHWVRTFGGEGDDSGVGISLDASGNVYTAGFFRGSMSIELGSEVIVADAVGLSDVFISKMNAFGSLEWVKTFGSVLGDSATAIATDALGNVYACGSFSGDLEIDVDQELMSFSLIGGQDVFIMKLDAEGNVLWVKTIGGNGTDQGTAIGVDDSGHVYVAGFFQESVDFDPGDGVVIHTSNGSLDVFILKLDNEGGFVWSTTFGGPNIDEVNALALDGEGNIYTTGGYFSIVDFDPGNDEVLLTSEEDGGIFVHKLDSSGEFQWVRTFGGGFAERALGIAVDPWGDVCSAGYFGDIAQFNTGQDEVVLTAAGEFGDIDAYVHKVAANGDFLWARSFGSAEFNDIASSIAVDLGGNIYTTGRFGGPTDFDPGSGSFVLEGQAAGDVFVHSMDADGNFLSATSFGGSSSDQGTHIAVDENGIVHTTGFFGATVDFDPGIGQDNANAIGSIDAFVHKMTLEAAIAVEKFATEIGYVAYPNPTSGVVNIRLNLAASDIDIIVRDVQGRTVLFEAYTASSNLTVVLPESPGMYFVTIKTAENEGVVRIIRD